MTMLKADGVALPTPAYPGGYKIGLMELSKADRNANGTMIKEVIGYKTKIECKWKKLSQAEVSALTSLKRKNFFTLEYIDMDTGTAKTGTFYSGDLYASAMQYKNGDVSAWLDASLSLIER